MEGQQHQIKQAVEGIAKSVGAAQDDLKGFKLDDKEMSSAKEEIQELVKDYAKDSASAKEAMGLTDAMVEGIYGQAYRLYNTGKYKEASQLFRLLMMLNAKQPKYLLGLAACFHMMKEYKNAVEIYTVCGIVDPESPIPHYHASDCYMQMKDVISAIIALEMAVTRSGERAEYKMLKDRAILTIDNLKKELLPKQL